MGFRFRKSISIAPGVRLNIGKNGISSLSLGKRGVGISIGRNGTYGNISLPGTGLSYRTRIGGGSNKNDHQQSLDDNLQQITEVVNTHNAGTEFINSIHTLSPNMLTPTNTYVSLFEKYTDMFLTGFAIPEPLRPEKPEPIALPLPPTEADIGTVMKFFSSKDAIQKELSKLMGQWSADTTTITEANAFRQAQYVERRASWSQEYMDWTLSKRKFDGDVASMEGTLPVRFASDDDYFDSVLMQALSETEWLHETNISVSTNVVNSVANISIDLPEIEDIPSNIALIKGGSLSFKDKSQKALRMDYATYIHGIVFRAICIVFDIIPIQTVKLSAYTQRLIVSTGYIDDDYILTCTATREQFCQFNFLSLDLINPISALESCGLERKMTSTGIFKSIPPLTI
jgi:hypothetical protein